MDEANPMATTTYTVPLTEVEALLGDDLLELANAILGKSAGLTVPVRGCHGNRAKKTLRRTPEIPALEPSTADKPR